LTNDTRALNLNGTIPDRFIRSSILASSSRDVPANAVVGGTGILPVETAASFRLNRTGCAFFGSFLN
jgi:hypothetical protein